MKTKLKNIVLTATFVCLLFALSIICILKPSTPFSTSERRALAQFPELSAETIFSGEFMDNFEQYTADQFPMREQFRSLKAFFSTKILGKKDNNQLYSADGHISKLEYPENPEMLDYAAQKLNFLYSTYMKDKNVNIYSSLIPDKNYFLAESNGYLSMDYKDFIERFNQKLPFAKPIDLLPLLSADDYYQTDSHWKQESIIDVAQHLANQMGTSVETEYHLNTLAGPFHGVFAGQLALPAKPDTLNYLTSDTLDNCIVTYYDSGKPKIGEMYNMEKANGKYPYEMFLSGSSPLLTIENPNFKGERELIIFRDSYAGSLAPLLASGYKKITLVDIRYIQSGFVGNYVNFDTQDVLFLYSTSLINNSTALR